MNESYGPRKHSNGFTLASLVLGVLALVGGCCVYPSIVFGALAIMFALLSKGGELTMSTQAKTGLILGIIGVVFGIAMIAFNLYTIFVEFGGIENYLEYCIEIMESMYPEMDMSMDYLMP